MQDITFRQILDSEGNFKHLQLIQGNNVINLSLGNTFASGEHSYVWDTLKETVDGIKDRVNKEAV